MFVTVDYGQVHFHLMYIQRIQFLQFFQILKKMSYQILPAETCLFCFITNEEFSGNIYKCIDLCVVWREEIRNQSHRQFGFSFEIGFLFVNTLTDQNAM